LRTRRYFAGIANAVVDNPDNVVAGAKQPRIFFYDLGEFLVNEKVAEFFSSFHSQGDEGVADFGFSDAERKVEFFVVETR
jgi:hypothetical protein